MTYLGFSARERGRVSAHLAGLVALCGFAACESSQSSGADAMPALPGSDASSIAAADDAPSMVPGDDASPGAVGIDATSPLSPDNFPATFAGAICGSLTACCWQAGLDSSSCRTAVEAAVRQWVTNKTSDPKVVLDEALAARCIEATRAAYTACTDRELARQSKIPCHQMTRGTVPIGGACTSGSQCVPQTDAPVECDKGACAIGTVPTVGNPRGALGEPCMGTCRPSGCQSAGLGPAALCWTDDGLYCPDMNRVCTAAPAVGQPCSMYCAKGAHCASGSVCAPNLATGPCQSDDDCVAEAYCAGPDGALRGQCALLKENGAACTSAVECSSGQCLGAACRPWSMANDAVCSGVIF